MCTWVHSRGQKWPTEAVCGRLVQPLPPSCSVPFHQVAACCLSSLYLSLFTACRASLG